MLKKYYRINGKYLARLTFNTRPSNSDKFKLSIAALQSSGDSYSTKANPKVGLEDIILLDGAN